MSHGPEQQSITEAAAEWAVRLHAGALSEEAQKLFALTARAADQYVLAYPELRAARGSSAWTEGPVIV